MRTVGQVIDAVIQAEGSTFTDDPTDRGGPTRWGITQATLSAWRGRKVSPTDVRLLERDEAVDIYYTEYVMKPGFDQIHWSDIRAYVVDCGVHHGPKTAARWLQRAVGSPDDGVVGPKTREALEISVIASGEKDVLNRIVGQRVLKMAGIMEANHDQAKYANGWLKRAVEPIWQA